MSKIFVRSSLCAFSMIIMIVYVVESFINLDKSEGRLDIIVWSGYIERG